MQRVLLGVVVVFGCGTPAPSPLPSGTAEVTPVHDASPSAAIRLEVVEGTPSALPDGTTVMVKDVGYAHLGDSKNLSNCTLVVSRDGQIEEIGLAYEHGGAVNKARTKATLGWQFTLEMADPYSKPSRATLEVTKR